MRIGGGCVSMAAVEDLAASARRRDLRTERRDAQVMDRMKEQNRRFQELQLVAQGSARAAATAQLVKDMEETQREFWAAHRVPPQSHNSIVRHDGHNSIVRDDGKRIYYV